MQQDDDSPNTQNETTENVNQDWNETNFPTSVKPVVKIVSLMIVSIIFLCWFVFYISEKPPQPNVPTNQTPEIPANKNIAEDDEL